jgi:hypothetical protein
VGPFEYALKQIDWAATYWVNKSINSVEAVLDGLPLTFHDVELCYVRSFEAFALLNDQLTIFTTRYLLIQSFHSFLFVSSQFA